MAVFYFGAVGNVVVNGVPKPSNSAGVKFLNKFSKCLNIKMFNSFIGSD